MKVYLVGGAVRDSLLGLPVAERDWVVVGATEGELLASGYRRADAQFPVFLHPDTGEEYALARREVKTGPGYKGFRVDAGPTVTLEEDLARRDLTINAMAQAPDGTLIDPFNGRGDLEQGLLRHVTPAFVEDPVRMLRVARFAATLGYWGFRVAHETQRLMRRMSASDDLRHLRRERVWSEMRKSLAAEQPWRFFEVLGASEALATLLPELAQALPARAGHRDLDATAPLEALKNATAAGCDLPVRFAALFAPALEPSGVEAFCARLRPPGDYSDLLRRAVAACNGLDRLSVAQGIDLLAFFYRERAFQLPQRFAALLHVCRAQAGHARVTRRIEAALRAAAAIQAKDLLPLGLQGEQLRAALDARRAVAIDRAAR